MRSQEFKNFWGRRKKKLISKRPVELKLSSIFLIKASFVESNEEEDVENSQPRGHDDPC